jgi:SAM-dependent methyltransferase
MSVLRGKEATAEAAPAEAPPVYLDARAEFAARYLFGEGLEIGPLHLPLKMPAQARVRYVDRMPVERLRKEYPELAGWDLTPVDVIDDGERLATIAPESQDFIVANHFLEHCEDPIGAIETHLGKLKPGGVLFYAVPDKRYTFDFRRPAVSLEHMVADHEEGPEGSRREHYEEWSRLVLVEEGESEERMLARARELEDAGYSIHMHAWTQAEFLAMVLECRRRFGDVFDIEAAARQGIEFVVVLRKHGPLPAPPPPAAGERAGHLWAKLRRRVRAVLRGRRSRKARSR